MLASLALAIGAAAYFSERHVTAVTPQSSLVAQIPQILAALALLMLLLGFAASLIALQRLRRGARALSQCMINAVPYTQNAPAQARGFPQELHRLEELFDEMNAHLRAQTEILDQVCELSSLGVWTILPDLQSVRASSKIRGILGLSEENEVVQLDALRERIVPEDRTAFDSALERAVKERRMTDVEFRALNTKGEVRVFWARTGLDGAVPNNAGEISGVIQDITDRRHKETALVRTRRLERLAGKVARVGGWRYDVETGKLSGTREMINNADVESGGPVSLDEMFARIRDDEHRGRIQRSFWICVGVGTSFDEIFRYERSNGTETWLRVIGEAERDQSGTITGVYGATQDVGDLIAARRTSDDIRSLLRTTLDTLSDGFVIHDCKGTIQYMNRKAHSILGVPDLDLVGGNIWQDIPSTIGSQLGQVITEALETEESKRFEDEVPTPEHCANISVHPTATGVAIYLNDVTEEHEVRSQLRLLGVAIAQVSDVVMITDASSTDPSGPRVVFVNEAFQDRTGYSQDEILGETLDKLRGPETEPDRVKDIQDAIRARVSLRTELTNYRKDGTPFTVEMNITPLFDASGECTHFVAVQRDTTERQENEERLRRREEQFRLASLASQDVIWDWDIQTGVIWNSNNSDAFIGPISHWHVDNFPDGRIEDALERIHPDDRSKITKSLDAALAGGADTWHAEYRAKGRDDSWRDIADKAFIVRDDDGAPRRVVGAMSDVTDFRRMDAQLHQSQKLEAVGQLTGGIAHDFNNLITIILGNCDLLLDDIGEDSPLRPLLQSVEDAAERAARVSSDLLAFSRRQPIELRPTDINELIRRSASLFKQAVDASIVIHYDLTDSPTVAYVDPDKLESALLNLVINAFAAIPDQGTITFRTRTTGNMVNDLDSDNESGEYVQIDVIDDGSGMAAEVAQRAFEPFFTTKDPGAGTGMGLSLVYGLMMQSHGHASIASEPGKSTTVTLRLPVAHEPKHEEPTEIVYLPRAGQGRRILVVEDEAELRTFVGAVLTKVGYRIQEVENGAIALELLETDGEFDLIVADIVMPGGVNGAQLAQQAQEMYPQIRILFTSGYTQNAFPKERHVPRDIPILYKPFRRNELIEKVEDALANEADTES